MSDSNETPAEFVFSEPRVALNRMGDVVTFEVMDNELDSLDRHVSEENQALGFLCGAGGVLVSLIASAVTASGLSPGRQAVLAALTATSAVVTLWSGFTWNRVRKLRPKLMQDIRSRARRPGLPPRVN